MKYPGQLIVYREKLEFPLVFLGTQFFTSASTTAIQSKLAAPVAGISHICSYLCFTCRYSPQRIKSSGYAANLRRPNLHYCAALNRGHLSIKTTVCIHPTIDYSSISIAQLTLDALLLNSHYSHRYDGTTVATTIAEPL